MSDITTHDEAVAALEAAEGFARNTYGAHHVGRLRQLSAALATARMALEHLADEEPREVDLANRIIRRETVHGPHEATSPVGRSYEETLRIAGVR